MTLSKVSYVLKTIVYSLRSDDFSFASVGVVGGDNLQIHQVQKVSEKSLPSLSPQPSPLPEVTSVNSFLCTVPELFYA